MKLANICIKLFETRGAVDPNLRIPDIKSEQKQNPQTNVHLGEGWQMESDLINSK